MPADLPAVPSEGNHLPTASPPHTVIRDNMRITPSFWDRLEDWWWDSNKTTLVAGLIALCLCLTIGMAWMGTRPSEQGIEKEARIVAIEIKSGEDLGSIGARYGRSRIEMIGFNLKLIERNTLRCGENKTGACRRDKFGERELAFDAAFPGDVVYVIPQGALDTPTGLTATR